MSYLSNRVSNRTLYSNYIALAIGLSWGEKLLVLTEVAPLSAESKQSLQASKPAENFKKDEPEKHDKAAVVKVEDQK